MEYPDVDRNTRKVSVWADSGFAARDTYIR